MMNKSNTILHWLGIFRIYRNFLKIKVNPLTTKFITWTVNINITEKRIYLQYKEWMACSKTYLDSMKQSKRTTNRDFFFKIYFDNLNKKFRKIWKPVIVYKHSYVFQRFRFKWMFQSDDPTLNFTVNGFKLGNVSPGLWTT